MQRGVVVGCALGVIIACSSALPASAQARTYYPWCASEPDESGGALSCGFVSYAQCMATASGLGGRCIRNPFESPPTSESSRRRHRG
jgi:hypothetical protein